MEEIKNLIQRVAVRIVVSAEAASVFASYAGLYHLSAHQFESAAGNHAFDDKPEVFGITEQEGHAIRAFCQEQSVRGMGIRKTLNDWIDEALETFTRRNEK